jgi:GNAT superfamily N-acetyltransferase
MGWTTFDSDDFIVTASPAESARFGIEVARVVVGRHSSIAVADVIEAIVATGADLFIVRYPAEHVEWSHRLFADLQPRTVFHADTLMYWHLEVGAGSGRPPASGLAVETSPGADAVAHLIGRIFVDYTNHYAANPFLDHQAALEGYQEWATVSCTGGDCVTVVNEGEPIAVATLEKSISSVEILLAGVDPAWQGKGVYSTLVWAVEQQAAELGVPSVVISTQAHNVKVQRSWARHGFVPAATVETVHVIASPSR